MAIKQELTIEECRIIFASQELETHRVIPLVLYGIVGGGSAGPGKSQPLTKDDIVRLFIPRCKSAGADTQQIADTLRLPLELIELWEKESDEWAQTPAGQKSIRKWRKR